MVTEVFESPFAIPMADHINSIEIACLERKLERFIQDVMALRKSHKFSEQFIINMDQVGPFKA